MSELPGATTKIRFWMPVTIEANPKPVSASSATAAGRAVPNA
ncbi:MAG TPA: hypothetical protein VMU51_36075 [Mycobacteriales bacterium]|nr:hypothetical protein [Mycobacteriales bacterium]